jgi:hypothetical protein
MHDDPDPVDSTAVIEVHIGGPAAKISEVPEP